MIKTIIKETWNCFRKSMKSERGSSIAAAMIAASVISAGGGIISAAMSGDDEGQTQEEKLSYLQLPEYPEAEGARGNWWQTLQDWQKSGDYGATDMNWDEIFSTAKEKLNRYYWGGVSDTGLAGKVKASAARRGVSQSPALESQLGAMGQQESLDISDLFSNLTTQKAQYTESARGTWLSSLMNLAGLKPQFVTSGRTTTQTGANYGLGNMIGDVSGAAGSAFSQYAKSKQQEDFLTKLLSQQTSQASITDKTSGLWNA